MKKHFILVLCLLLLMSTIFVGCGKEEATPEDDSPSVTDTVTATGTATVTAAPSPTPAPVETITGAWAGTIDVSKIMNETLSAADESMADSFNFTDLNFDIAMNFGTDGICSFEVDEDSVKDMFDQLYKQLKPILRDMIEDMLAEQNIDMSVDEYFDQLDMSLDDLLDESFKEEDLLSSMNLDEMNHKGQYIAKDGKLYISEDEETEVDVEKDSFTPYEIKDGKLTIDVSEEDKEEQPLMEMMFPLVLERK